MHALALLLCTGKRFEILRAHTFAPTAKYPIPRNPLANHRPEREAQGQGSAARGALGGLVLHHAEHLLKFREADIARAVHVKRGRQALDAVPQLSTLGCCQSRAGSGGT